MQNKRIVILGGGTAGWMSANLFAHRWQKLGFEITVVESKEIGIVGVGEGSTPTLKRFFEMLDIAESDWMPKCNATYKVNIRFAHWSPASGIDSYSHPFISQLDTFTQKAFYVNCRTRRLGLDTHVKPEDFLINGVLAQQGLGPKTPPNFPFRMEYGYHFDSHLLGEFLAEHAANLGVKHVQANINSVELHPNGDIKSLITEQGEQIDADFFVDCSGFRALLIQQTLDVKFKPFKNNLFNDSAVVMPTELSTSIPVETRSTALSNGWAWQIPLTNRFGNGYVFSSDFISPQDAELELRKHLGQLDSEQQCRHLKMRVGQVEKHWYKNCLAIGLSQGFIEPLEATALHLVQIAIEMFMDEFEQGKFSSANQQKYNDTVTQRFERVRDYIVAHYKLNTRNDTVYWQANRENDNLSDSLVNILQVWYKREDLESELNRQDIRAHFDTVSWHCLLAGYGAFPPLAANQPGKGDLYRDQNIAAFLQGCALNFDDHKTLLKRLSD